MKLIYEPIFDETLPHPWRDPVNTTISTLVEHDRSKRPITVRNPIRRMRNGTRSGVVDWHATALSLAERLYQRAIAHDETERKLGQTTQALANSQTMSMRLAGRTDQLQDLLFQVSNSWWFKLFATAHMKSVVNAKLFQAKAN